VLRVAVVALVDGLLLELELGAVLEGLEAAEGVPEDDRLPELVAPDAPPPDEDELPGSSNGFGRKPVEGDDPVPVAATLEGSPLASNRLRSIRIRPLTSSPLDPVGVWVCWYLSYAPKAALVACGVNPPVLASS